LLALVLVGSPSVVFAQKVDVITMVNGDRVTCEIKLLDRGIVEAKTDSWGTLSIEWTEIARVTSPRRFEIELRSGARLTGRLEMTPDPGYVVVVENGFLEIHAIADVVVMKPVGTSIWRQLDGAIDAGYSYASAGKATQSTLSADIVRRRERVDTRWSLDSFFSSKEGAEDTNRHSLYGEIVRYLAPKWGTMVLTQAERNDELDLHLRVQAGGALTRYLLRSNRSYSSVSAGVVYNHEEFTDETPSGVNWELVFGTEYEFFTFNSPKTRITAYFWASPSLSTMGRLRLDLNVSAKRDIVGDLFVSLSLVDSYDNRSKSDNETSNTVNLVTSVGWSF
jgi:hypothetical protein